MRTFTPVFAAPQGSPIRELFKYLSIPDMISLAGGYPASDLFDEEGLAESMAQAFRSPVTCLQYSGSEGLPGLREALANLSQTRGIACEPNDIVVTSGSQQGFDLLVRVLLAPGDTVLVEQPTYPATLQALRLAQARIDIAPSDADGIDPVQLDTQLAGYEVSQRPKLLYVSPTFANPTGLTLALERRKALLAIAARYGVLVVEDDPYGDLRFTGTALPTLAGLARVQPEMAEQVVYLSSLSKIVAPGVRIGWMVGPADILQRCTIAKQTADLCTSGWMQAIAEAYLRQGFLERHLPNLATAYHAKCEALVSGLQKRLGPRFECKAPEGGLFVWGRWSEGLDAKAILEQAIAHKVLYVPGSAFYAALPDHSAVRLSFAAPSLEQIGQGVERLAAALNTFEATR
jgi:DNA-binding transcriptional MocR family regulator